MRKYNIAILLATYNGEKYLSILLDSLLSQSYSKWDLFIHDDGSNDKTLEIITTYLKKDSRIHYLKDNKKHRGAKLSFFWLLEKVEADYYLFCDQDDLWLPYKIQDSYEYLLKLEKLHDNKPICIHTDLAVTDSTFNITSKSLWKSSRIKPKILENLYYIQLFNCVTGCTMIFNNLAKKKSLQYDIDTPMHDWWIAYNVLKTGGILSHLNKSTILYRQHNNNEIGANFININYFINKIKHIKSTYKSNITHYKYMKRINGLSLSKYIWYKISYEFIRLL